MRNGEDGTGQGTVPGLAGDWVTIAEAARRLDVTPKAIRNRIHRGTLTSRPAGNRGREVLLQHGTGSPDGSPDGPGIVELMVRVARLEGELAGLRVALEQVCGERDRLRRSWLERMLEAVRRR